MNPGPRPRVHVNLALTTPQDATTSVEHDTLVMNGQGPADQGIAGAMRFEVRARVLTRGGQMHASAGGLSVRGAEEVRVLIVIATNYRGPEDLGADPALALGLVQ